MSFWDIVWFLFIGFAFAAYLMVLFTIIGDLFRDPDVSGGAKAAWVVALIFLPFASSLVYLISRGTGMAHRSARIRQEAMYR
jgi:Phospholipase_D-nuclease N-terminal